MGKWANLNLSDLADITTRKGHANGDVVCLNMDCVESGSGKVVSYSDSSLSSDKLAFSTGDVLFAKLRPYLKKYWLAEFDGLCSSEFLVLRAKPRIRSQYLYYVVSSEAFVNYNNSQTYGSKMPRTSWEIAKKFNYKIPELPEQDLVLSVLTASDEAITASRALVEKYAAVKRGLMQDLLGKGEMVRLGVIADSFQYGLNAAAMQFDGENKYLRITDIDEVTRRFLSTDITSPSGKLTDAFLLAENDIVFARTGASVGKTYIYDPKDGVVYFAGFLVRCRVKPTYCAKYIFYQTLTDDYKRWVSINSQRSGQPGVNAEQYKKYEFKCPLLPEQERIAAILTAADECLTAERERLAKLESIKRGLMDDLLTNRVSTDTLEGGLEYA